MNKKKLIFMFIVILILSLSLVLKNNIKNVNNTNNNINLNNIINIVKEENLIKDSSLLESAINNYNLEDKYVEKTIDGHIVCRTDLNCLFRYYMECKSSDAVFFDKDANKGFIFVVRGFYNDVCNFEILSGDIIKEDNKICKISLNNLSKEEFDKVLLKDKRNVLDYCK